MAARASVVSSSAGGSAAAPRRGRDAASRAGAADGLSGFYAMATGQIESGEFQGCDNLFVRYAFTHGPDWRVVQGIDHGFSQVSAKGSSSDASVVWNLPLDVTFKSTNAHGWPRLVLSVYSQDFLGRYVVRGYGSVLIPTVPGRYVRYIRTFAPMASTILQQFLGWLTGSTPEFYDSRFAASSEGREVTRVESTGTVRVTIQVLTRGMASHGFSTGGPPDLADAESEAVLGYTGAGAAAAFSTLSSPITASSLGGGMAPAAGLSRPTIPSASFSSSSSTSASIPASGSGGARGGSVGRSGSTSVLSSVPEGSSSSSSVPRASSSRASNAGVAAASSLPPLARGAVKEVESVSAGGDAAPSSRRAGLGVLPPTSSDSKAGSAADAVLSGDVPSSSGGGGGGGSGSGLSGVTTNEDGDLLLPRRTRGTREGARRRSNSRGSDTQGHVIDITSAVSGPGMVSPSPVTTAGAAGTTASAGEDSSSAPDAFARPARPTNRPGATRSNSGRSAAAGGGGGAAAARGFGVDYGSPSLADEGKADR